MIAAHCIAPRASGLLATALLAGLVAGPVRADPTPIAAPSADRLRVAYEDTHNFPFHLGTGASVPAENPGLSPELVRRAAEALGMEVEFQRLPWRRCLRSIGDDRVDAVFNASFREERRALVHYPMRAGEPDRARRITTARYVFYRLRGTAVHWNGRFPLRTAAGGGEPFAGPVGSVHGYSASALLREQHVLVDDVGTRNSQLSLRKLIRGRVPVIVDAESRMRWFLARERPAADRIEVLRPAVFERDYYLVLSHAFVARFPERAEELWTEIGRLRDSPEFDDLRVRYDGLLSATSVSRVELAP